MCEVTGTSKNFTHFASNGQHTMRVRAFKTVKGTESYSSNWSNAYSFTASK